MQALRQQILPRMGATTTMTMRAALFSTSAARPLAKMQLIGRLAAPAEETPTSTGRNIIKYALGVSQGAKDENGNRGVSWFRVASFAEGAQKDLLLSLPKGTQMYVEAEARMDSWQAEDGTTRSTLNLLARNFEALARPQNRDGSGSESA